MSDMPLAPAAVVIQYPVGDFDHWKGTFDAHEADRIEAGFLGHHINRAESDPNSLAVFLAVGDVDKAKAYATSDKVKALMQEAGVMGQAEVTWVTPVAEDVVWDRELPAVMVIHTVADFDAWLAGYLSPEADEMRKSAGIIGHAANQGVENPLLALVYHQAESFDAVRALTSSDELRHVMKDAGVTSEPEFSYHTGGWGKFYQ
ncbi:MAG: hypothetical protein V3R84_02195 [Acidimicrobiia bacterium]